MSYVSHVHAVLDLFNRFRAMLPVLLAYSEVGMVTGAATDGISRLRFRSKRH
jgi:hypothetical protein